MEDVGYSLGLVQPILVSRLHNIQSCKYRYGGKTVLGGEGGQTTLGTHTVSDAALLLNTTVPLCITTMSLAVLGGDCCNLAQNLNSSGGGSSPGDY